MNRFDYDNDTVRKIIFIIETIASWKGTSKIERLMKKTGFTFEEYRTISDISMPTLRYSNLYRRTKVCYNTSRRKTERALKRAREMLDEGAPEDHVLELLMRRMQRINELDKQQLESITGGKDDDEQESVCNRDSGR